MKMCLCVSCANDFNTANFIFRDYVSVVPGALRNFTRQEDKVYTTSNYSRALIRSVFRNTDVPVDIGGVFI